MGKGKFINICASLNAGMSLLGRERQYKPCISISARCWSASSVNLNSWLAYTTYIYDASSRDLPDKTIAS